jgi:hypothetical protein
MKKQIEINVDKARLREIFKIENLEARKRKSSEQKFLNKMTVAVCTIAFLIVFAAYHLLPVIR